MNHTFESRRVDGDELAARIALQVVMVWGEWLGEFIALFPAVMDDLDDTKAYEAVQVAIDAGAVARCNLLPYCLYVERLMGAHQHFVERSTGSGQA